MTTPQHWPYSHNFFPFDKVKDTVSGVEGKITAQYNYPNGCIRYEITLLDKDNKIIDYVFDSQQLELIERAHENNAASDANVAETKEGTKTADPPPAGTGGPTSRTPVAR